MKKRILATLLALCLLLGIMPTGVKAAETSGSCGENAFWSFDEETGTLTISGTGDMYDYTYVEPGQPHTTAPWQYIDIKSVVIEDGITHIGNMSFYYCANMTEITLPDSLVSIGSYAMGCCYGLTSIVIPKNVAVIGRHAFTSCGAWADYSFVIKFEGDAPTFGDSDYGGDSVFTGVTATAYYPENNETWTAEVMDSYGGTITWFPYTPEPEPTEPEPTEPEPTEPEPTEPEPTEPEPVTSGVCGDNATWSFDEETGTLTISGNGDTYDYVPYGHTPWYQFYDQLVAAIVEEGITGIGDYVFFGCDAMSHVTIADSVIRLGDGAFWYCENLSDITIPNSVTSIGKYAFEYCSNLSAITIPDSVTCIGKCAFDWCESLTTIRFEGDAPTLGEEVFNQVTATAYYPEGNSTWTSNVMQNYGGTITWVAYTPEPEPVENPFTDVPEDKYYYDAVLWAYENGITAGATATSFAPNKDCTRGQIVTFLWRAAGEPEPTSTYNPFTDVDADDFYYKAVLWAVEKGITSGATKTTFDPKGSCTRAQVVTFMHRAAGSPAPKSQNNPFADVSADKYYHDAVLWAVENGITQGMSAAKFGPNNTCTRGQIVTFLHRGYAQ